MAESSLKRRKAEEEDRLSSLPDSILCHILSFLPTRTSVATMTLVSHRWRHLWEHLQVFDFDDYDYDPHFYDDSFKKFASFVNAVLTLRRSRNIRKFRLNCDYPDPKMFELWFRAATGPHLQELSLTVLNADDFVKLPPSLFINCNNLVSLRLHGVEIHIKDQHSPLHFPLLKRLKLGVETVDSVVAFLSACPVLETLDINFFLEDISLNEVPIPPSFSSKSLKSTNHNFTWTHFKFGIYPHDMGIVGNFHSMVEAFLDVFSSRESEFVDPILNSLFQDNKNSEINILSRHLTSKLPLHAPVLNYPEFRNLFHLKFILPCFNSNLLVDALEKCHVLRVLIIKSSKEEPRPLRTWEPESTTVFECLKSHLTYIHIEGYQGLEDELAFADYILRNGLVLKTMLIFVDISMDKTNKYCSLKRLTDIPKGSVTCELKFDPALSPN
ncbi:putative F-box domain, FBD domain, leucine-rich repeat domain, L domain-containing protein [Medicago truncatula]|uniref:F-box/RNI/FBD-like domain protein n=1 Tax=Medicago truncatula TaxID=3880 RepID=A0A072U383_MEDTR|nr:F-box/FBD/LRR-repeat protein At5g56420 [Medicago truncatula]KEH20275.1 F-box/RNI/FBD-like domain protein [Medicago truncatula]RHN41740.1 putative F-box domain, FBD domain, leucine-rich repeat domain, L domain-containing protein [Medicago truncatula]